MKRVWLIAGLAVFLAAVAGWWWATPQWPEFPSDQSNEPQVVVQVDRDFAYHVGDLIPLDLYVKQKPGTKVEPITFAVDGDFELAAPPTIASKQLKDGTVLYRLGLKIQSFAVKKELVLNATMGWSNGDDRLSFTVPPVSLFWSNTWDGRPVMKEGDDARIPFYWYGGRHILAMALSSLLLVVLSVVAIIRYVRSRPAPKVDHIRNRVVELLERVKAGTSIQEEHLELDGLMRDHFGVGPIPASKLDAKYMVTGLAAFLKLNAPAVYSPEPLGEEARVEIYKLGNMALTTWKA